MRRGVAITCGVHYTLTAKDPPKMKPVLLAIAILASPVGFAQAPSSRISSAAVWQIPSTFRAGANKACDKAPQPPSFADCFINQMAKAGAPAEAVAFARELQKQSGGEVGIASGFEAVGPVDVAFITYPLRANTNYGLVFVNGTPRIIDAEDLKLLDQTSMQQSPQFQNTKAQFPNLNLWPGDRDGTTWPNASNNSEGGVSFTLGYPLRNGCHACANAGFAEFNWKFDPSGKFLGTSFMGMTAPPLQ